MMSKSQLAIAYFRMSAADGNNIIARIRIAQEGIDFSEEIQEEFTQLQNLEAETELIKTEILQFFFQQRDIMMAENENGTLNLFLENNSKDILDVCKNKLQRLSVVACRLILVTNSIKNKRPDSVDILDKWLDSTFLNAVGSDDYSEHILGLMQKG